ncbi:MAG: Uma2 family endonuclease [Campylobacterales bacterium]|nr:Uma2 family endonuclease [Campylobacterales bacterium]
MGARVYQEYYTYDDYVKWDGDWELIDGFPYAMAPASTLKHQATISVINYELRKQLENYDKCEVLCGVDYKISNDTILRPDVVLTCGETNENYLVKVPEIVVEIVSRSSSKRDERYKFEIYEAEKVKYYILVYPDDLVAKLYKLNGAKYEKEGSFTTESYKFDGLTCDVCLDFSKVFKRFR